MESEKDLYISQLLVSAQGGDQEAYSRFLSEVSHVLRSYLARRMGEKDMIDDVLQETLIIIHRARHTYLPERRIGPWLYGICNHRLMDFYRKLRRVQSFEHASGVLPDVASSTESPKVGDLLIELPEHQRSVIQLLKVDGFSVHEISQKLGMSESNVKITAFRGYETLRRLLGVRKS